LKSSGKGTLVGPSPPTKPNKRTSGKREKLRISVYNKSEKRRMKKDTKGMTSGVGLMGWGPKFKTRTPEREDDRLNHRRLILHIRWGKRKAGELNERSRKPLGAGLPLTFKSTENVKE